MPPAVHSKCKNCLARQNTEWKDLDDNQLDRIDEFKQVKDWEPGKVIYHQGYRSDGVYCIQSGLVGIRQLNADGSELLLRLCNPGDTIGYRALLSGGDHTHFAEVLEPSHICFLDKKIITELLASNPIIGERFLARSLKELSEAEDNLIRSQHQKVRTRLLHCLMSLYEQYGSEGTNGGHVLDIPVSRRDLASLIAVAPESISRTINTLEVDGLVHFEGRRAHFKNLESIFDEIGAFY